MRVRIGEDLFKLSEGQVALTNIGQSHSGEGDDVEFISVALAPALVSELISEIDSIYSNTETAFRSSVVDDGAIARVCRSIADEISDDELGRDAMIEGLVRQLVVHLIRSHLALRRSARVEMSRAGPVDRRLRRAIEFMHDNFGCELALEEIAAAAYLSEYHFARLFKQIMGVTPHVYLANLRIERARKLLIETSLPISEVAALVGYQSQSHFTKIFKSITALTPRAYRNGREAD